MTLHIRHVAAFGLPLLLAVMLSRWHTEELGELDGSLFDDPDAPALELLQRDAKVVHMSKKPINPPNTHIESQKAVDVAKHRIGQQAVATTVTTTSNSSSTDSSDFGISSNGVGNLPTFLTGVATDAGVLLVCFVIFARCSKKYPIMYFGNAREWGGHKPFAPLDEGEFQRKYPGFFGWASASWATDVDDTWKAAGLDHAMLIHYVDICFNCFKWIALPMFFIQGPLNCFFGGNAAGQDHESWFSMGNVEYYCWLYWPISFFSWYVVIMVTRTIDNGMKFFLPRRAAWLRAMTEPRSNTLMMIGIPEYAQSDEDCKNFWNKLGFKVKEVHIAKDLTVPKSTSQGNQTGLQRLVSDRNAAQDRLVIAEAAPQRDEAAINKDKQVVADSKGHIDRERDWYFGNTSEQEHHRRRGFVTFEDRKDAEKALRLDLSNSYNEWILDYAPVPQDIIWADLEQDENAESGRALLGYALTAGMVIVYMPIVVFICNVATAINLGPLQSVWSSEAPSLGLTLMVDFMPTILVMIFTNCFSLYDKTQCQYKLTVWYWWLNVLYVVMITALGTNFLSFVETLSKDPLKIFSLLADTMPECTHYYMNYVAMQSYSHGMVLTRYIMLTKYCAFSNHHDEDEAKSMSEPEDQDYYGMGSRTARWSTMTCIGIVFGTLSPPVSMLTFFLFFVIRIIYGFLFNYSESKKSDLGGIFFHRALHNTFISLHIYMVLMIGVFCQRAGSWGPVLVLALAWAYVFQQQKHFGEYRWEKLPYTELIDDVKRMTLEGGDLKGHDFKAIAEASQAFWNKGNYVQPELQDVKK